MSFWRITGDGHPAETGRLQDGGYTLSAGPAEDTRLTILDDFDWHIWRAGLLLIRRGAGPLELYQGQSPLALAKADSGCRFWQDVPSGDLAQQLKRLIGVRAFMPKYVCQMKTQIHRLLNEDEKTVAQLLSCSLSGTQSPPLQYLEVVPLRGYEPDHQRINQLVAQAGAVEMQVTGLRELLPLSGMQVEFVPSKPAFDLKAQEPAEGAVLRMLMKLLEQARHYESGICADIDTECVHQYRVNIRKARSLTSLFKKSFSPERYKKLSSNLKALGALTNELRDLDVFLLDYVKYQSQLPADFRAGLKKAFGPIRRRRKRVAEQTTRILSGPQYAPQIEELLDTLQALPDLEAAAAQAPIKALVQKKVLKQYRRIRRQGRVIKGDTPDEAVHEIRIECKKLRYLLELFGELFPQNQVKPLVRLLKRLQDNLGRFNDYAMQGALLRERVHRSDLPKAQLAGISALLVLLHNHHQDERRQVEGNIAAFIAKGVRRQVQRLCTVVSEEDG